MFKDSDFVFQDTILEAVLHGQSPLDVASLGVESLEQAQTFMRAYGYDWDKDSDREMLWSIHRQSVILLKEVLLKSTDKIPEVLTDPGQLGHLGYLLMYASTQASKENEFKKWSCAILRVMHVLGHLKNDLSGPFIDAIQAQIARSFKDYIYEAPGVQGVTLGLRSDPDPIKLYRFDIKSPKSNTSAVIKLLANPEYLVPFILDRVGVRFVTKGVYDAFRVLRFLLNSNLVSFPNNIRDQARNTIYPTNLFLEVMLELKSSGRELSGDMVEEALKSKLQSSLERAEYKEKYNAFSGGDYRSIKFISRRRITVGVTESNAGTKAISFFYPYEIQIMDHETYLKTLSGPTAHDRYKERQIRAARLRVLGQESEGLL